MAKLTPAQIRAGFGGKRALAALRARFRRKKAPTPKPRKVQRMARRKTKSRRSRKGFSIAGTAVALNAVIQGVEPYISAGIIDKVKAKDWKGTIEALKTGSKEAASMANLLEAVGPAVGLAVLKFALRMFHAPNPSLKGVRAW